MTTYSLIVENKSILTGSICVYQRDPQQRINRNLYSLAWFSKMPSQYHGGVLLEHRLLLQLG